MFFRRQVERGEQVPGASLPHVNEAVGRDAIAVEGLELAVDDVGDEGQRGDRLPARRGLVRRGHPRTLPAAAVIRAATTVARERVLR